MDTEQRSPRAFAAVLDHIESGILDGTYRAGDTLPPERELAARLGVSRAAVREAIRALEAQGVLAASVGAGKTGGTRVVRARGRALSRLLRLHVALGDASVGEVVELRVALERTSAALAAAAVDDALVERMTTLLDAMDAADLGLDGFNVLDTELHVTIAEAASNSLVTDLTTAVREALRAPILAAEQRLADEGGYESFRAGLVREHRGLVEAIAAGDGPLAAERVEAHVRSAYRGLPGLRLDR